MEICKTLLLVFAGASYGMLSAAGVFTVLVAVGLIPRFAGRTHTANKAGLYENMVIVGTCVGCFVSIFPQYSGLGELLRMVFSESSPWPERLGIAGQIIYGFFSGAFIGCLALAIAELLDSIPIMTRRIRFKQGLSLAVYAMAIGKLCGALFYLAEQLESTMRVF